MEMAQQLRFVRMPDGRRIAYRELGCQKQNADKSMVVLHGLMSSRRVAMPGASQELLEKYGLRMIAIDRPGYGQSDPHCAQTFKSTSLDIEYMIDELDLGEKIWLLGFSMGGAYCWGAARHIPDRLAGIAMASPAGNFWWKSIPEEDQRAIVESYSLSDRIISAFNKRAPFPMIRMYAQFLSDVLLNPSIDVSSGLSPPDRRSMEMPGVSSFFLRDDIELVGEQILALSRRLLAILSENLQLPSSTIEDAMDVLHQKILIAHYPPCPQPDLAMGSCEHTDVGVITCVWQASEDVVGLQVRKDGQWHSVEPYPGAIVVNVGDQIEVLSNGVYKSGPHRVVLNSSKSRISVVAFHNPSAAAVVSPATALVDDDHPPKYEAKSFKSYAAKFSINAL